MPHLSDVVNSALNRGRDLVADDPTLAKRNPSPTSSSASSSTCVSSAQSDTCEKPSGTSAIVPIALGVAIPLTLAIIVLFILHRRNKKRQRLEDRNDAEKYRSLDFGMDLTFSGGKNRKKAAGAPSPMAQMEGVGARRKMKGLSIDAGPFMFPGNTQDSAASIHSLSRSGLDSDGRYRLADDASIRSFTPTHRGRTDTDSTFDAASSTQKQDLFSPDSAHAHLLRSPQPPAKSLPPRGTAASPFDTTAPPQSAEQKDMMAGWPIAKPAATLAPAPTQPTRESYVGDGVRAFRKSNNYLKDFIHSREGSLDEKKVPTPPAKVEPAASLPDGPAKRSSKNHNNLRISIAEVDNGLPAVASFSMENGLPQAVPEPEKPLPDVTLPAATSPPVAPDPVTKKSLSTPQNMPPPNPPGLPSIPRPPRKESIEATPHHAYSNSVASESSNYDGYSSAPRDSSSSAQPVPPRGQSLGQAMPVLQEYPVEHMPIPEEYNGVGDANLKPKRLSVFMRPLPPEDPAETPEVRANRIRSFYKEYFDKNDNAFQGSSAPVEYQLQPGDYYEDYDQEYMNAATIFDPDSGTFVVAGAPYAQPVTRRAMTPPPRAPPRFRSNFPGSLPGSRAASRPGSRSTSGAPPQPYGQGRASSSTGRYELPPRGQSAMSAPRGRTPYKKQLPPPSPLVSLPTPHLLKNDTIFNATIDFAPPTTFRDRQAGRRPDSPLGTPRPYSPSVRSFTPLASPFDDLNVVPSPHMLRKSGLYTSLDFAPPKRFKNDGDTSSDGGSIRSGRSGMSAHHMNNIRNGAYRVSKLPKELAGTRDDLNASLRPTWDMRGPA